MYEIFIQINSSLIFLLYDVQGVTFFRSQCIISTTLWLRAALVDNSVLYVFDTSPITAELGEQQVVHSEIHIYKRHSRRRKSPRWPDVDIAANVYQLTRSALTLRSSLTVSRQAVSWQTLNVTDVVLSQLADRSTAPSMIAVSFADMVIISSRIYVAYQTAARQSFVFIVLYSLTTGQNIGLTSCPVLGKPNKPKFHYADFHRNFPAGKVSDTNYESRRHKPSQHVEMIATNPFVSL